MQPSQPPRPLLDVYKKIAIIRKPSDSLIYEDSEGNVQRITDLGEAATVSETVLTNQPKAKSDIPTPRITTVRNYENDVRGDYFVPHSYIRYKRPSSDEAEVMVDYNLDAEDEEFLKELNREGDTINASAAASTKEHSEKRSEFAYRPTINADTLELIMDILEKAAARHETIISQEQAERLLILRIPQFREHRTTFPLEPIYQYWMNKRNHLKKPLLRQFWPVTMRNDTNPHLVFRQREKKEKYKLRKKRQNDIDAYRKMQLLKRDLDLVKSLLDLVLKREKVALMRLNLQEESFHQRIYDCIDTSGLPRPSRSIDPDELDSTLSIPKTFKWNTSTSSDAPSSSSRKKKKKRRDHGQRDASTVSSSESDIYSIASDTRASAHTDRADVPLFIHPLPSRQAYVTSWDHAVPFVSSYSDGVPMPTYRFRHRPRIGRGGRIMIDRLPTPGYGVNGAPQTTIYIAGEGLYGGNATTTTSNKKEDAKQPQQPSTVNLLDLLTPAFDPNSRELQEKVSEICMEYATEKEPEDEDGVEVLVKMEDWIGAEEPIWGEEKFAIGPL